MSLKSASKPVNERSDATRRRLIDAGVTLFGSYGYEGTTTRALADAAGANLAAIPYHFGGKDGLYRAVAQTVIESLDAHMSGFLNEVQSEIDAGMTSPHQALALIERMMKDFSDLILITPQADHWICFLLREQMSPTEAFVLIYESPIKRMRGMMAQLLSGVSGLEADHPKIRMTCLELLGLVYVFRVLRASTLREMGWSAIDQKNYPQVRQVILENTDLILKGLLAKA